MRNLYEEHRHSEGVVFFRICNYRLQEIFAYHIPRCGFCNRLFLCLEPDIVETLLPLLSNSNRTRRHVVMQLVHMGLVENAKALKKPKYVLQTNRVICQC